MLAVSKEERVQLQIETTKKLKEVYNHILHLEDKLGLSSSVRISAGQFDLAFEAYSKMAGALSIIILDCCTLLEEKK